MNHFFVGGLSFWRFHDLTDDTVYLLRFLFTNNLMEISPFIPRKTVLSVKKHYTCLYDDDSKNPALILRWLEPAFRPPLVELLEYILTG